MSISNHIVGLGGGNIVSKSVGGDNGCVDGMSGLCHFLNSGVRMSGLCHFFNSGVWVVIYLTKWVKFGIVG